MDELICFFIFTAVILLVAVLVYVWNVLKKEDTFISSKVADDQGVLVGEHHYFLPAAALILNATATVRIIARKSDGQLIKAELLQTTYTAEACLVPETTQLLMLNYHANFFSSDDIHIKTNQYGLLESITAQSEDRIAVILESITKGKEAAIQEMAFRNNRESFRPSQDDEIIVKNIEYSRSFHLSADEVYSDKVERSWLLPIDGVGKNAMTVDASFQLISSDSPSRFQLPAETIYKGILTRPLTLMRWDIEPIAQEKTDKCIAQVNFRLDCLIPDVSKVINIPLKRTRFVKNTTIPKFVNGLLVENHIEKPSEAEAIFAIPLNIFRAFFSIPSQLLHFRITRNIELAALEKSIKDLSEANPVKPNPPVQTRDDSLEKRLNSLQQILSDLPDRLASSPPKPLLEDQFPKLGKLPPDEEKTKALLEKAGRRPSNFTEPEDHDGLPEPGTAANWLVNFTGDWKEYKNLELNTCVPAAAAHMITSWQSSSKIPMNIPSETAVLDAYKAVSGFSESNPTSDKGCRISTFLEYWRETGLGTDKIRNFTPINIRSLQMLKTSVYWYGGCLIGLQMPESAKGKAIWEVSDGTIGIGRPGSWGGHAVPVIGYDASNLLAISWGKPILITHEFYMTYNDEAFIILSDTNWTTTRDATPTSPSFTLLQLNNALNEFARG